MQSHNRRREEYANYYMKGIELYQNRNVVTPDLGGHKMTDKM